MIPTYIYGTPHGFNFYEEIVSLNDYFRSFYISSRRGKRLMVNRKDDGSTIYSFLCYGIMENKGRPDAFFGFSVVLNDSQFSPDFKVLFEWFDYLFEKTVSKGGLLFVNEGGKLQYKVDKFSDISTEIEWLKSNLPNIFTKSSDISLLSYDNSFSKQNLGKVICCNIDTPKIKIIDNLKKAHWVAISPDFVPEQEVEEIKFSDLESKLNGYNQNILSIAVNPSDENLPFILSIKAECTDIITTLNKNKNATTDDDERKNYIDIIAKYDEFYKNLSVLVSKINSRKPTPHPIPAPEKKVCQKCKRELSLQNFKDNKSHICNECSSLTYKTCIKCHKNKDVSKFTNNNNVCDDCASKTKLSVKNWLEKLKPAHFAVIVVFVVLICGFFIIKSCVENQVDSDEEPTDVQSLTEDNVFDKNLFNRLISQGKFVDAFHYADSLDKKDEHIQDIKNGIESAIDAIIETTTPYDSITTKCLNFTASNMEILTDLGYNATEINTRALNYQRLCEIVSKANITPNEQKEAMSLIATLPKEKQEPWKERIANISTQKMEQTPAKQVEKKVSSTSQTPKFIIITNQDNQYKTKQQKNITQSDNLSFYEGTYVLVQSDMKINVKGPKRKVNKINNNTVRIGLLKLNEKYTFTIGDKQVIITVVKENFNYVQ